MRYSSDAYTPWCVVDWAFLRPRHLEEDQRRFAGTVERAYSLAARERVMFALREQDRPWWARLLADHPRRNIIEQPFDRGSGTAVLIVALSIERRDPGAQITLLGRSSGTLSVRALLDKYRKRAPELYAMSTRAVRPASDGRMHLDGVYPYIACMELESVLGS